MTSAKTIRPRRVLLSIAAALVLAASLSGCFDTITPSKNYYNGQTCVNGYICKQSGTYTTVYTGEVQANIANAQVHATLDLTYDATKLNIDYTGINATGPEWTDIVYYEDGDGGGAWQAPSSSGGQAYCLKRVSLYACDMAVVIIDVPGWCQTYHAWTGRYCSNDTEVVRSLTCHETGHAVGLLHGSETTPKISRDNGPRLGCMADMMWYPAETGIGFNYAIPGHHPFQLGSNQAAQINSNY